MTHNDKGRLIALLPFIVFVSIFILSLLVSGTLLSPLFSCMVALIVSLFTFKERRSLNQKVEIFLQGASHPTILAMCFIFIFSGVFTYAVKAIHGVEAAVNLGLYIIPSQFLLPGFFIIVSLFALSIGSSMGSIAAFLPLGVGLAHKLGINPSLISGLVVGAAMFGDNLSIISDTTIAATQTTETSMTDKFWANLHIAAPAFLLTVITLFFINLSLFPSGETLAIHAPTLNDLLAVTPYLLVFGTALAGLDVIVVLVLGIIMSGLLGIYNGVFTPLAATSLLLDGFVAGDSGIQEVLILVLLIAGLSHIVDHNGGIQYIIQKASGKNQSAARGEITISILVFLVNAAVTINTISILITGRVAKHIGDAAGIKRSRIASLLDVSACVCQGILPYAPQLLLASSLAGISAVSILPYLYYQWFTALCLIGSIIHTYWFQFRRSPASF